MILLSSNFFTGEGLQPVAGAPSENNNNKSKPKTTAAGITNEAFQSEEDEDGRVGGRPEISVVKEVFTEVKPTGTRPKVHHSGAAAGFAATVSGQG